MKSLLFTICLLPFAVSGAGLVSGTLSPAGGNTVTLTTANISGQSQASPNSQLIQSNYTLWANTSNSFVTAWTNGANGPGGQNGWYLQNMFSTNNGVLCPTNQATGVGLAMKTNGFVFPLNGSYRVECSLITGVSQPIQSGEFYAIGFETNTAATDQSFFQGFGLVSGNSLGTYRDFGGLGLTVKYGAGTGINGTALVNTNTKTTYYGCMSSDISNVNMSWWYPGYTNLVATTFPRADMANVALSNLSIIGYGTNVLFGNIGGRTTPQTFNPRGSVEGQTIFSTFSKMPHTGPGQNQGDDILVFLPPNMDSGTNVPNFIAVVHGSTGLAWDIYNLAIGDSPTNGDSVPNYFMNLCTNGNNIIACYTGDAANIGLTDTWNTTNSQVCLQNMINYVKQRWPYGHLFLWGESAGGSTALGFVASHAEKVCGLDMNHAVVSISNSYTIDSAHINTAYGGSTIAELATGAQANLVCGDPYGLPTTMFAGVPIRAESSFSDRTVFKTNHTDLLIKSLGGGISISNATAFQETITYGLPLTPETDDVGVNAAVGHGYQCYTPTMAASFLAWEQRCIQYENASSSTTSFGIATNTLTVGSTGVTNYTSHVYLLTFSAGSSLALKDATGTQFLTPVNTGAYPLRPGWILTGSGITASAVQLIP